MATEIDISDNQCAETLLRLSKREAITLIDGMVRLLAKTDGGGLPDIIVNKDGISHRLYLLIEDR